MKTDHKHDPALDEKLMDHEYDGIKELDNDLPAWWQATFYVTILFSAVYIFCYHVLGKGDIMEREYADAMRLHAQVKAEASKNLANLSGVDKALAIKTEGAKLYAGNNCIGCHGPEGQGLVGPNLTDAKWIHGSSHEAVLKVLSEGVLAKGMPSMKGTLSPEQLDLLSSYIVTELKGKNLPGKAPEGTLE